MRRVSATTAALASRKISPVTRGINPPLVYPNRGRTARCRATVHVTATLGEPGYVLAVLDGTARSSSTSSALAAVSSSERTVPSGNGMPHVGDVPGAAGVRSHGDAVETFVRREDAERFIEDAL
jgi:hypothetical protein